MYHNTHSNISHIGFIDVNPDTPTEILNFCEKPILYPGELGTFDDCGVMPSHVIKVGDEYWMYYLGWNVRNTIAYHNSIGLAISKDECQTFQRYSQGPLFDRNYKEPYYSAMPYLIQDNDKWHMWYMSNTKWEIINGKSEPYYHIKYASSNNGIDWHRDGEVSIDYMNSEECGIARPCVIKCDNGYQMWYSYRGLKNYRTDKNNSYKIGYAESLDGRNWHRFDDQVGIKRSNKGWDSQMIEYPFIYMHKNKIYMLYNGNKFGETGFGYAKADININRLHFIS